MIVISRCWLCRILLSPSYGEWKARFTSHRRYLVFEMTFSSVCSVASVWMVLLFVSALAQQDATTHNQTLLESLIPNFFPMNDVARVIFPPSVSGYEVPFTVRINLFFTLSAYEITAACHPAALSFFGVKDDIPSSFCDPLPREIIRSYINYRINAQQLPQEAQPFGRFLADQGLTPFDTSTNTSTLSGWANLIANRANAFFSNDGWNSLGNLTRDDFRRPYFDQTGYTPINLAGLPLDKLKRPLRWQPLTVSSGFTGSYISQTHVTPQLSVVTPLALSKRFLRSKKKKGPYRFPNMRRVVSRVDRKLLDKLIDEYFEISRQLTPEKRFAAFWWDNKFLSLGAFIPTYVQILGLKRFDADLIVLSEAMAQHDALVVAWREKIRQDLVRPVTIIRKLKSGQKVRAFISEEEGVGEVDAGDFEPLVRTQPHSEFPSASAVLCRATFELAEVGLKRLLGRDLVLPRLIFPVQTGTFSQIPVQISLLLNLSAEEARVQCGQSRLYAGVHFSPSIRAGDILGRGIGIRAFRQMFALSRGRVPDNCPRCIQE